MPNDPAKQKIDLRKFYSHEEWAVETGHCDTCIKNDVCTLQTEYSKARTDINSVTLRDNVFIDVTVKCKKWASGYICNTR